MLEQDRDRGAKLRAERVRWKGRSRSMSRASKNMDERLRKMRDQASTLDKRLSRHAEEGMRWDRNALPNKRRGKE